MAKNDVVLLDSILSQRVADSLPSNKLDEVFEFFGLEQILKDFDLSKDELEFGWIDGFDDGGIDAFFVLPQWSPRPGHGEVRLAKDRSAP